MAVGQCTHGHACAGTAVEEGVVAPKFRHEMMDGSINELLPPLIDSSACRMWFAGGA
jgi:hypothetical protein